MATKDFSSKQIRVSQLLASGGIAGTSVGMAIYSASNASNLEGGISDSAVFNDVGSDVFLFVSGTVGGRGTEGITAFGGDLHISGNLTVEGSSPSGGNTLDEAYDQGGPGAGREINVDSGAVQINTISGTAFLITGSAGTQLFSNISGDDPVFTITNTEPGSGQDAKIQLQSNYDKDNVISPISVPYTTTIQQLGETFVIAQNRLFGSAQTRGALVIGQIDSDGVNSVESYSIIQTGSAVGTDDLVMILSGTTMGASDPNPVDFADTSFFVSGAIDGKDGSVRGVSVFGGDVVISGSIYPGGATETLNIGSPDQAYLGIYSQEFYGDLEGAIRFNAKNDEGDTIQKGQVVYIKGISGQTATVALAACDDPSKMPAFGLAGETAADGANMQIVTFGDLGNINLNTLYAGSFTEGDVLYVATGSNHTSGSLTNIRPTGGSNLLQNMGFVVRDGGGSDGRVKVGGAGRSNATPNLNDGQIFIGDSTNCSSTASLGLNLAYASGSGAIIGVDGQPVQLQAGSSTALAVTGSIIIDDNGTDGKTEIYGDGKGYFYTYGNFAYNEPKLSFYRGRGTETSITSPVEGDDLGQLSWLGYSGGIHRTAAAIQAEADADHGASAQDTPGRLLFKTAQDGTSTLVTRQTIKNDGTTLFNLDSTNQTDSVFLVSGSIGGKGTEGTSVFGGDVVISGSLHGGSPLQIGKYQPDVGTDVVLYVSGTTPSGGGGKGTPNGTTVLNSDLVVSGTYRGGYDPAAGSESFQAISDNYLFMSSDADFGSPQIEATDSNFFFTGSIGSRGGGTPGTAVFGGDLHVSGAITADGGAPAPTYRYDYLSATNFDIKASSVNLGCYMPLFAATNGSVNANNDSIVYTAAASGSIERVMFTPSNNDVDPATNNQHFFKSGDEVVFFVIKNEKFDCEAYVPGGAAASREPHLHLTSSDSNFVSYNFANQNGSGTVNKIIMNLSDTDSTVTVSGSNQFDPGDTMIFGAYFKSRSGVGGGDIQELGAKIVLKFDESITYP